MKIKIILAFDNQDLIFRIGTVISLIVSDNLVPVVYCC